MKISKKVSIIEVPYLYGKDCPSKTNAPKVIRSSGLFKSLEIIGASYRDSGDIRIESLTVDKSLSNPRLKYLTEILSISKSLIERVKISIQNQEIPIILGGDHSVAIGSVLGMIASGKDVTVVWIDTHGDFHTSQTTPSGRLHGMALALCLGLDNEFSKFFSKDIKFLKKKRAVLFGAQKFDDEEKETIERNISLIDMPYIVANGIGKAVKKLLDRIQTENIHLSLDLDSVDKQYAPGTDMSIDGALTYRELMYTLEILAKKRKIVGMDVVEYDAVNDLSGKTAGLAIESITTALGRRIGTYELYMDKLDPPV